jgi:adenine-specific DNA-methyltransferase
VREAARECRDWADAMVVCGFAFDPQVGETTMNLGRLVVLKARMNQADRVETPSQRIPTRRGLR